MSEQRSIKGSAKVLREEIGGFPYLSSTPSERVSLLKELKKGSFNVIVGQEPTESFGGKNIFEGVSTKLILTGRWQTDMLANLYNDRAINLARFSQPKYSSISPLEAWDDDGVMTEIHKMLLRRGSAITPANVREMMYSYSQSRNVGKIKEVSSMRTGWMIGSASLLLGGQTKGKKWIDMSAGWGDRLISSIVLGMEYTGYDPNTNLIEGHSKIIEELSTDDMERQVIVEPFEDSSPKEDYYDLALTSPPYFNLEIYSDDENQSTTRYPTIDAWSKEFMQKSLDILLKSLKVGGMLAINISDYKNIPICKGIRMYMSDKADYRGMFTLGTRYEFGLTYRTVWVWKKT